MSTTGLALVSTVSSVSENTSFRLLTDILLVDHLTKIEKQYYITAAAAASAQVTLQMVNNLFVLFSYLHEHSAPLIRHVVME